MVTHPSAIARCWAIHVRGERPVAHGAVEAEQALSVQRGTSVHQDLGQIRQRLQDGEMPRDEAARLVVDLVEEYGLQPVEPPAPVEPINVDDLGVVCWMAVVPTATQGALPAADSG